VEVVNVRVRNLDKRHSDRNLLETIFDAVGINATNKLCFLGCQAA
jgi:hypothetical protein